MIRPCIPHDFDTLQELWDLGFPGEHEFGRFILERFGRPENILVYAPDNRPSAMVILLPRILLCGAERLNVSYIMGVTTRPELRGQGVMSELMRATHETLRRRHVDLAALIPAQPSLFDYYARFGYEPFFMAERKIVTVAPFFDGYTVDEGSSDFEVFDAIYRLNLNGSAYLERSESDWHCAFQEHRDFDGKVLLLYRSGLPVSYAFYYFSEGKTAISEALGVDETAVTAACAAVLARTGSNEAKLTLPAFKNAQPFGAVLPLSDAGHELLKKSFTLPPYINLIHN